jgi:hypothetical protein
MEVQPSPAGSDYEDGNPAAKHKAKHKSGCLHCSHYLAAGLVWISRPLTRALQNSMGFYVVRPGPGGGPGAPGKPPEPSVGLSGASGASRRPPGRKTNQSKQPRNLKDLIEQWRFLVGETALPIALL